MDAAKGLADLMASYLQGPSTKAVVLEAKLPSLAAEEAKQKGCEPLLIASLHRKTGSHGFMKALSQAAGSASWNLPYGGSTASSVARAGTAAGLQTVSSMAQSTKARDEISLEYSLQSADGQVQFGPRTERQKAKADGEDLLTPVVMRAAEAIISSANSRMASSAPGVPNDSSPMVKPASSSSVSNKEADDAFSAGAVQYLDHLKTCTPYTWKYPSPLAPASLAGSYSQNIIRGKKGNTCQVSYLMPNNLRMECEHSAGTIKSMTSEAAYKAARAGEFSFSFGSNSDDTVVKRECHL